MGKYLINPGCDNSGTCGTGRIYRRRFGSINYFVGRLLAMCANLNNEYLQKSELYESVYLSPLGGRFGIGGYQSLGVPARFVVQSVIGVFVANRERGNQTIKKTFPKTVF